MGDVLFCPFCREDFEGQVQCPHHGLRLVAFQDLPATGAAVGPDDLLPWWTAQHGRLWVALGALLSLVACPLPLASLAGDVVADSTLLELVNGRAQTLWLVPMAACAQWALLLRRRTLRGMQGMRVATVWLALLGPCVVALTWSGAHDAALRLDHFATHGVELRPGIAVWLLGCGALFSLWGAWCLGAPKRVRPQRVQELD